jgi:hypothetical protein
MSLLDAEIQNQKDLAEDAYIHQGDSIDAGIRSNLWIISMMQIGVVKTKPWGSFES